MNDLISDVELYVLLYKRLEECWKYRLPIDEEDVDEMNILYRSFNAEQIRQVHYMLKGEYL